MTFTEQVFADDKLETGKVKRHSVGCHGLLKEIYGIFERSVQHMARGKSFFLGILAGSTIGAAAALLSTPESGRSLRSRAKEQRIELKDLFKKLTDNGLQLKNQLTETSKEGAVLAKELTLEMKNSVEEWKKTVEPHQENIHEYLEQIESSLKDLEDKVRN
ncbi:YtxH domain-containing protein [Lentibacillus salinarum]|uniref:YtxH domain-containing protein n=1 Tax=Lentibacillus salinarum TaxID=446820 RepID=A0ABW3ZRV1_9BACI